MDTLNFLRLVWPEDGIYLLALPATFTKDGETHHYHKHHAFTSIDHAAQFATSAAQQENVFFALSTVKQDYTAMNKTQRDAAGVKVRGGGNADRAKAFWLDIDVKDRDDAYPTQQDAALALRQFVSSLGLPKPYVVSSGGGLHVYWPLSHAISADTWHTTAAKLKALTVSAKLKADPSRTADVASILRPVGTANWKTGEARAVEVMLQGSVVSPEAFAHQVEALCSSMNVEVYEAKPAFDLGEMPPHLANLIPVVNLDAAAGAGQEQPKASVVVKHCPQLLWMKDNPAAVSEPQWYSMIGCLRFADKGHKAIHMMSQGHPQYSVENTDNKIVQHENSKSGPTLCTTFAQHNEALCGGCVFKGRIRTPLQAGRSELPTADAPVITVETVEGEVELRLPSPPAPYKRVQLFGSDHLSIAIHMDGKGEMPPQDVVIYEYDLFPAKLIYDERDRTYNVQVKRWLPQDGWGEFTLPMGRLYDKKALATTLGNMGTMPDIQHVDTLVQYMVAYIRELQKAAKSDVVYAKLGWRDDGSFVLPELVIHADGTKQRIKPSPNIVNTLQWKSPKGSLEEWKKIPAVYERPGMEGFQFAFMTGFASPLFKFTNFTGAAVNIVGARGAGKSSALMCSNSIWGHWKMCWADAKHDTQRAFYGKLGVLGNLPASYDEITNLDPSSLSDLTYSITKGQGRQRLTQTGSAAENFGSWELIQLSTSNAPMHTRLSLAKDDASAEASRIFEYHLPQNTMSKAEADDNFDKLNYHFGLAAEPYVEYIVKHREKVISKVRAWIKEIDAKANVLSSERFWSAVAATVLASAEVTNKLGLTNVDIERLVKFSVQRIHDMRGEVRETTSAPKDVLSEYLNSKIRSMIVLEQPGTATSKALVSVTPSNEIRIRLERFSSRMYIDRADFRRFCAERGAAVREVEQELRNKQILLDTDARVVLGKDTVFTTSQTRCWLMDYSRPELGGVTKLVDALAVEADAKEAKA